MLCVYEFPDRTMPQLIQSTISRGMRTGRSPTGGVGSGGETRYLGIDVAGVRHHLWRVLGPVQPSEM